MKNNAPWQPLRLGLFLFAVVALLGCAGLGMHDAKNLIAPTFQWSELVGFIAGFGTTFAGLPDLTRMLKRRSSSGMNPRIVAILCAFQFVWIYYGLLIGSRPVVIWNVIAIVINGLSVGAYLHFARRERSHARAA